MKSYIVSVINAKGGVGKTSVTCNLGYALARLEKRVLLIDMDPQCNTTSLFRVRHANMKQSLFDLLDPEAPPTPIEKAIYPSEYANISLLPNIPETAGLEPDLIRHSPKSLFRLREKIRDYALEHFNFVLIDCPPNLGSFVISGLYTSSLCIVPTEVDSAFSLDGLTRAMDLIKDVRQNGNPDLRFLRLLINKVDKRVSISKVAIQHIKANFQQDQYFSTTIPINIAFKMAEQLRRPIFKYNSAAPGAKAYRKLADELLSILPD